MTGLGIWYIFISMPDNEDKKVQLPLELPVRTPRKWVFQSFHAIGTQPSISYSPFYDYATSITPLTWTFKTLDNNTVAYTSDFLFVAPEAIDDGKFEFSRDCADVVPDWPFPAVGTQISR
jgi:hypothetical protein